MHNRKLLLLRHGKSDWATAGQRDWDRPLTARGERAAKVIGGFLKRIECVPDRIVASGAVRAKETARGVARSAGFKEYSIVTTDRLYEASPRDLLDVIQQTDESVRTLLLVGHEPGWSATASALVGGGSLRFPTCALACIELPLPSWENTRMSSGQLLWFVIPRMLEHLGPDAVYFQE
ncbi:histidine phosphatase family protein [soil metagenome]